MISLHVLTGFLGAGKTTLLRALLQAPNGARIAVLVNEVGELAVDQHLLERLDDDVLALASGCLCCSLRGDLLAAIDRLLALRPSHIVLETSGVADPAPILQTLASHPRFGHAFTLGGVITVADATRIDALLAAHPEVGRQLEMADLVVLTRTNAAADRLAAARADVRALAVGSELIESDNGKVPAEQLLAVSALPRLRHADAARSWLHQAADGNWKTHAVVSPAAADIAAVQLWLRLVAQLDAPRLLRIKGLVLCRASGRTFALQSAGAAVSPPRALGQAPTGMHGVQMVLIERGMPAHALQAAIAALHAAIAGTRA